MNNIINIIDQSMIILGNTVETIGNIVEILLITKKAAIEIDNIPIRKNNKINKKVLKIKNIY